MNTIVKALLIAWVCMTGAAYAVDVDSIKQQVNQKLAFGEKFKMSETQFCAKFKISRATTNDFGNIYETPDGANTVTVGFRDNQKDPCLVKCLDKSENGFMISYDKNGTAKLSYALLGNVGNGYSATFHPNGNLATYTTVTNMTYLLSPYLEFDSNGKLASQREPFEYERLPVGK